MGGVRIVGEEGGHANGKRKMRVELPIVHSTANAATSVLVPVEEGYERAEEKREQGERERDGERGAGRERKS